MNKSQRPESTGKSRRNKHLDKLAAQVEEVVAAFPTLSTRQGDNEFVIEGSLVLEEDGKPFDAYEIHLIVPYDFPEVEPKLFEIGDRLEKTHARHFNKDGTACYEVFEYWLATTKNPTVLEFVEGPVVNFFLSQTIFELTGEWRFDERAHGLRGIVQAAAEALGTDAKFDEVLKFLRILRDWPPKGHHICPCGSGEKFRDCHRDELCPLHKRISENLAKRMTDRLLHSIKVE